MQKESVHHSEAIAVRWQCTASFTLFIAIGSETCDDPHDIKTTSKWSYMTSQITRAIKQFSRKICITKKRLSFRTASFYFEKQTIKAGFA
jgi:hypothetical protein